MICPACNANNIPENSVFCNMCGINLIEAMQIKKAETESKQRAGMIPLAEKEIIIDGQKKMIKVMCKDVTELDDSVDLLTVSAYPYSYYPTPRSVIGALQTKLSISVEKLAGDPLLDLRKNAGCWISKELPDNRHFRRIGGVEILRTNSGTTYEDQMIQSIKSYMYLLDILTAQDPDIKVIVFPLLGTGDMHLDYSLLSFPIINEITCFLSRNRFVQTVLLVEKNYDKARFLADSLDASYHLLSKSIKENTSPETTGRSVFVSYADKTDRLVAERICEYLEAKNISYWFAPKSIVAGDYASEIVCGINQCTHFICIISETSMKSPHVLNEVDLAFQRVSDGVQIIPFRIDHSIMTPAFKYYLSRMQTKSAFPPPLEDRIRDFIEEIFSKGSNNE